MIKRIFTNICPQAANNPYGKSYDCYSHMRLGRRSFEYAKKTAYEYTVS